MATLRVPDGVPSPSEDAETLRKAFKGWGTDEKAVIEVLGHRNASQRREIKDAYRQLYQKPLGDDLHSELTRNFAKAVKLWMYDPPERDARQIQIALKKQQKGSIIKCLGLIVEIVCTASPHHLVAVRQAYCSIFHCSVEEDIASNISPPLKKLLVGLVTSYRYDQEVVDNYIAEVEATKLREAIERKQLDEDELVWILSTRNVYQLRATFELYYRKYGSPIHEDIKACGDDDLESLVRMAVWCLDTPEKHFAKVIRNSVVGIGTDDKSLIRVIVSRAEVDLMNIRGEYFNMYKSSLDNAVSKDTSGDYRDFLMALLGVLDKGLINPENNTPFSSLY